MGRAKRDRRHRPNGDLGRTGENMLLHHPHRCIRQVAQSTAFLELGPQLIDEPIAEHLDHQPTDDNASDVDHGHQRCAGSPHHDSGSVDERQRGRNQIAPSLSLNRVGTGEHFETTDRSAHATRARRLNHQVAKHSGTTVGTIKEHTIDDDSSIDLIAEMDRYDRLSLAHR
jgi:hypothetical protein